MSVRNALVSSIETLRRLMYRGPIKRVVARLGLDSRLKEVYSSFLGSVSDSDVLSHEINGFSAEFHASTGLEVQRFQSLMDEDKVLELLLSDVTKHDVFYDIGSNVGLYTCFLSQIVDQTVAFEPHPANLERLKENIKLNNLENVTVRSEALSNTDGTAELAIPGADVAGEGTHTLRDDSDNASIEIKTARGDSICENLPTPDVMKIDVEGAELSVLRGFEETLEECRLIYCETHPGKLEERGESVEDVLDVFSRRGFETTDLTERGSETFFRAKKSEH